MPLGVQENHTHQILPQGYWQSSTNLDDLCRQATHMLEEEILTVLYLRWHDFFCKGQSGFLFSPMSMLILVDNWTWHISLPFHYVRVHLSLYYFCTHVTYDDIKVMVMRILTHWHIYMLLDTLIYSKGPMCFLLRCSINGI